MVQESKGRYHCRICGSASGRAFDGSDWPYWRCTRCRSILRRIDEAEYRAINTTYDAGEFLTGLPSQEVVAYLGVDGRRRYLRGLLDRYFAHRPGGLRFLDIGCGMGGNLLAARQLGLEVLGLEPSESHSKIARDLLELPVRHDYFSPGGMGDERFDLVMLSHVIEHIYRPKEFLAGIAAVMRPNGILVVVTPNSNSVLARVLRGHWPMLRPIDHVSLLSRHSIEFIISELEVVDVSTSEFAFEFASATLSGLREWVRRASRAPGSMAAPAPAAGSPLKRSGLSKAALRLGLSVASFPMRAYARRVGEEACLTVVARKR